jgi:hypothetical protein
MLLFLEEDLFLHKTTLRTKKRRDVKKGTEEVNRMPGKREKAKKEVEKLVKWMIDSQKLGEIEIKILEALCRNYPHPLLLEEITVETEIDGRLGQIRPYLLSLVDRGLVKRKEKLFTLKILRA